MVHYQYDSPQAAARIAAICVLADARASRGDLETIDQDCLCRLFSLRPRELRAVMETAREDLASTDYPNWHDACLAEPDIVRCLASEIRDPARRLEIVEYCEVRARCEWSAGHAKACVLQALCDAWHVPSECEWVRRCDVSAARLALHA